MNKKTGPKPIPPNQDPTALSDPSPDGSENSRQDSSPGGNQQRRFSWLGCLIGVLVVLAILLGAGWYVWRILSPSGKRIEAAANPGSSDIIQLPGGFSLRIPKGSTPTPTFTPSLTPSPTISPTPTEIPTNTPIPTPIPVFTWKTQVLRSTFSVGAFSSLKIDSQGYLHVLYFQDTTDKVWYGHNTTGDWEYEFIQGEAGHGFHLSLALDGQDMPHFAYNNVQNKNAEPYLWYRWLTPYGWSSRFREGDYKVLNSDISMALDPSGMPYFSFQSAYDYSLMVATFTQADGFITQKVGDASENCSTLPIVVDTQGDPHVSFCAPEGLVYAHRQGDNWRLETVDPKPGIGTFSDLALDAQGRPHIAYYDLEYGILKYARRTENGWQIQEVDTDEDTGRFPSLAIDSQGGVHISYYDVTRSSLRYAYWDGEDWNLETVDRKRDVGQYNSLALDPVSGEPRISYYDATREDLKIALAVRR